tara:strand:- start:2778 stop:3020 length:243 start_codon:yes stop_codon:yes gene_type:complete
MELNLNNYNEDDVARLNAWAVQAARRNDMYEWAFANDVNVLQIEGVWWSYDTDGESVAYGNDMEEALWGAYDLAHTEEQK